MDTIMLVDEAGQVGGKVTFTEDLNLFDGLSSDSNVLDGCNIAELQNGAIWKDEGDVTIDSDVIVDNLIIEGNVKASADITAVKAGNKVDVKHFLNSLVLKSSDQSITAKVQFLNDIYIGVVKVDTINNVNIDELYRLAVLQNEDVVIKCDLSFTKGLTVRNLKINSTLSGRGSKGVLVNGVDLSEMRNQAVLTSDGSSIVRGRKTFVNAFTADHLNAVSVGGVMVRDLVVVTRDDIIADNLVYTAPISIFGDLLLRFHDY
ncbi:uncharacterized protein [Panulirus ornatus]|uniref:uncharacterized protein n=1 Tax=Panulirus ornatus TaxID=150431 RepID=UPI003A8C5C98